MKKKDIAGKMMMALPGVGMGGKYKGGMSFDTSDRSYHGKKKYGGAYSKEKQPTSFAKSVRRNQEKTDNK